MGLVAHEPGDALPSDAAAAAIAETPMPSSQARLIAGLLLTMTRALRILA
jgi:hypothetical protein